MAHPQPLVHFWWKGSVLLLLCTVCAAFGNSLQSISVLVWLHLPLQLLAYEHLAFTPRLASSPTQRSRSSAYLTQAISAGVMLTVAQSVGAAFAFTTLYGYPDPTLASILASAGTGAILSAATVLLTVVPYLRLCPHPDQHQPHTLLPALPPASHPLVLAVLFAASQATVCALLPDIASMLPANAVLDYAPVVPLATLGGVAAIHVVLALVAAAVHAQWRSAAPRPAPVAAQSTLGGAGRDSDEPCISGHSAFMASFSSLSTAVVAAGLAGLLLIGGGAVSSSSYAGGFHTREVRAPPGQQLPVACVTAQYALPGSDAWHRLWQRTTERVHAGDAIVMWAEEAVLVQSEEEETQLLSQAAAVLASTAARRAAAAATPSSSYLGIAYLYGNDSSGSGRGAGSSTNRFVLLAPSGAVVWSYLKAFPVPLIESDVRAGPPTLPVHDSPMGRLGGAICFDLDHAGFILQAGRAGVDIMLQPSWTWGLVGPRHWAGNTLRAAENGFTLFRCSSVGVSGVVSPRGVILQQAITAAEGLYLFALPRQHHVGTPYVAGGHLLQWLCVLLAVPLWLWAALLPALPGDTSRMGSREGVLIDGSERGAGQEGSDRA